MPIETSEIGTIDFTEDEKEVIRFCKDVWSLMFILF
jgi:hypothetical protein